MSSFPKWLHKGWKHTPEKAPGHHVAAESKLVESDEEAREMMAAGWTDAPPAVVKKAEAEPKKTEPKK